MRVLTTLVIALLISSTANAEEEWSTNFGWVSEYIFRGIPQDDSSAYVGLDYENDGFYAGTWAADVGQGSEVDFYFGYGGEFAEDWSYGVGATGYFYTDDFDDTYKEVNLSLGHSGVSVDAAIGEYDNFGGQTLDYSFVSLTGEYEDFYTVIGSFGQDFDGDYYEAGYGVEIGGFDVSVSVVHSTSSLLGASDTSVLFGIGRSISLRSLGFGSASEDTGQ